MVKDETKGEWYLRQMLGTANFEVSPLLALSGGDLCYQIEHHLFPDLPSNRSPQVAVRVRAAVREVRPAVQHGSLPRQYRSTLGAIHRLALPDRLPAAR